MPLPPLPPLPGTMKMTGQAEAVVDAAPADPMTEDFVRS
jgi:hypothetical protein